MGKKFWISVVALFVVSMALGFLVHGVLLGPDYAKLTSLFRQGADAESHFVAMLLAHAFLAVGFTWVYLRGREDKPFFAQGIRFGAAMAVLTTIPTYLIYLAVQPMPEMLVAKQIVFDSIAMMAMGVVVAAINK